MAHNILLTGASGYLGGDLLAQLAETELPSHDTLYALVRTREQAEAVTRLGAQPLIFDVKDEKAVLKHVVENKITIVFFLIDAMSAVSQGYFIKALAKVKEITGSTVHFLHTSGAKLFSSHAGAPTDRVLQDDDEDMFALQTSQIPESLLFNSALDANNSTIRLAEAHGVRSYIFIPCIVYGKSRGFGNAISIQTTAVVNAIEALGHGFRIEPKDLTWPVCHISDNTGLYIMLLKKMLANEDPDHGPHGYYLAASGSIAWNEIYAAYTTEMGKLGIIPNTEIRDLDNEGLEKVGAALKCPTELVPIQISGQCVLTAKHGNKLDWKPAYAAHHILETAYEEVERIIHSRKSLSYA